MGYKLHQKIYQMENSLPNDIALQNYNEMLKVKPRVLQSKYPFPAMDEEGVARTMKQIEVMYQNLTPDVSASNDIILTSISIMWRVIE